MPTVCFKNPTIYLIFIVSVLITFLLELYSATIIELPIKKFYHRRAFGIEENVVDLNRNQHKSRRKRATPDLNKMVNNVRGESSDGYFIDLNMGTPPQKIQVLIDTGSANLAVSCSQNERLETFFHRDRSKSYQETSMMISINYTVGWWQGKLGKDLVSLTSAPSLFASSVNIACIVNSSNFYIQNPNPWQGILGLAYKRLSKPDSSVDPFLDSVFASHPNLQRVFSIQLCGSSFGHTNSSGLQEGSLVLGGVLPKLAKSGFFYTPLYKEWFYELIVTQIRVDYKSLDMPCKEYNMDKTILDSGTTNIRLPEKVFFAVLIRIKMHIMLQMDFLMPLQDFFDGDKQLCYSDMKKVFRAFPVVTFDLMQTDHSYFSMHISPQHYLRVLPQAEFSIKGQSCFKFGFTTSITGSVLGSIFMEGFYSVFDRPNKRIGFAATSCPLPDAENRILNISIEGPFTSQTDFRTCAFKKTEPGLDSGQLTMTFIMVTIFLIVFIPLFVLVLFRIRKAICRRSIDKRDEESRSVLPLSHHEH